MGIADGGIESARLPRALVLRAFTDVTRERLVLRVVLPGDRHRRHGERDGNSTNGPQFAPNELVTRAKMAEFLAKAYMWWRTGSTALTPATCVLRARRIDRLSRHSLQPPAVARHPLDQDVGSHHGRTMRLRHGSLLFPQWQSQPGGGDDLPRPTEAGSLCPAFSLPSGTSTPVVLFLIPLAVAGRTRE